MTSKNNQNLGFADQFRHSAPYINAFRGRTFILYFSGEAVTEQGFANLIHDIALLNSLGIRLVLVHGAHPQIDARLNACGHSSQSINGIRITDAHTLSCVKDAVGVLKLEIEALLSMGLANSPMAGAKLRAASGNFVTARPYGIRDGVDYLHTGEVRRIDTDAINSLLQSGVIVLLSPVGYSSTGEIFNLFAEDVAAATATALKADKLLYLTDSEELRDEQQQSIHELTTDQVQCLLDKQQTPLNPEIQRMLFNALTACQQGVQRVHLINRHIDGALLQELFTRDGIGTLISVDLYEGTRNATIDDVNGILELIAPLERDGILVRRSREYLEMEIQHFSVIERDNVVIACAALYPFEDSDVAELACLAIHPNYRNQGRGDALLRYLESNALKSGINKLFVLTTHTAHWFQERGFVQTDIQTLPLKRQAMYNYQRNSKVFIKTLIHDS